MAKFPADGSSYIEVDDSGGTPRNLSPYVDEIQLLGQKVVFLDVTGLSDTAQRVIAGIQLSQDFILRGAFDDQTITGPDAVLTGIVGQIGTVSLGPVGISIDYTFQVKAKLPQLKKPRKAGKKGKKS